MSSNNVPTKDEVLTIVAGQPGISTIGVEIKLSKERGWEFEHDGSYGAKSIAKGAAYRLLKALEKEGKVKGKKIVRGSGTNKGVAWKTTDRLVEEAARREAVKTWEAEAEEKFWVRSRAEGRYEVSLAEPVGDRGAFNHTAVAVFSPLGALIDPEAEAKAFAVKLRRNYVKLAAEGRVA